MKTRENSCEPMAFSNYGGKRAKVPAGRCLPFSNWSKTGEVIGAISDTVVVLAAPTSSACADAGRSLGVPPTPRVGTPAAANRRIANRALLTAS